MQMTLSAHTTTPEEVYACRHVKFPVCNMLRFFLRKKEKVFSEHFLFSITFP